MGTDMHVYADRDSRLLRLRLRLSDDAPKRVWNQVAYAGEWAGHPAGEFKFTREVFEALIANFERRSDPIPLTYGHPHPDHGAHMGAAGWIHGLRIQKDDEGRDALYAEMEFTERAAGMVRSRELQHCSVVVLFDSYDEVTGEDIGPELIEVGLVLSAFIDGMQRLAASRQRVRSERQPTQDKRNLQMNPDEILNAVREALGLDQGATKDDLMKALEAVEMLGEATAGEPDDSEAPPTDDAEMADDKDKPEDKPEDKVAAADAPEGDVVAAQDMPEQEAEAGQAADLFARLGEALGVDATAAMAMLDERFDEVVSALQAGEGASPEDVAAMGRSRVAALSRQLAEKDTALTSLSQRVEELEHERAVRRIDDAIAAGHLADTDREKLVSLARKAPDVLDEWLSDAAEHPAVPTGRRHTPASPGHRLSRKGQTAELSHAEQCLYDTFRALGRTHDDALREARERATARA